MWRPPSCQARERALQSGERSGIVKAAQAPEELLQDERLLEEHVADVEQALTTQRLVRIARHVESLSCNRVEFVDGEFLRASICRPVQITEEPFKARA